MPLDRSITSAPLTILLVEDDAAYLRLAELVLADAARVAEADYRVVTAMRLSARLARLGQAVSTSSSTFPFPTVRGSRPTRGASRSTGRADCRSDEHRGRAARGAVTAAGAQDYLIKRDRPADAGAIDLRAIDRHQLQRELVNLSLTDELTGLNNRRFCSRSRPAVAPPHGDRRRPGGPGRAEANQ